jgi:hypothetical protein
MRGQLEKKICEKKRRDKRKEEREVEGQPFFSFLSLSSYDQRITGPVQTETKNCCGNCKLGKQTNEGKNS